MEYVFCLSVCERFVVFVEWEVSFPCYDFSVFVSVREVTYVGVVVD